MKVKTTFLGLLAGAVISAVVQTAVYPILYEKGFSNLIYYVLFCACIIGVSFFATWILNKADMGFLDKIPVLYWGAGALFAAWFVSMFFAEKKQEFFQAEFSLRHQVSPILYFPALLCVIAASFFLIRKIKGNNRVIKLGFAFLVASLQTACLCAPNIISDRGGTLLHIHAYFNPVYNAVDLLPYSDIITSIYGHYTLFYILPVRLLMLFGIPKVYGVMIVTMIVGFASFMLLYILLEKMLESNVLYCLSVIAVAYFSFVLYQGGQYYQLHPHRIFMPALVLFLLFLYLEKKVPGYLIWIVSALSILWNLETGVICLIVCTGAACMEIFASEGQAFSKEKMKKYLWTALYAFLSLIGGYVLLNVYNLLIGGGLISVKEYIFPIGSSDYVIEKLALKIPDVRAFYFVEVILFLSVIVFWGGKLLYNKKLLLEEKMLFLTAGMGLGLMTYYMNRAAFGNVSISHICFVVVISILLRMLFARMEDGERLIKNPLQTVLAFSLLILLSFFTLGTAANVGRTIENRVDSVWNMESLNEFCDIFRDMYPENTVAAGVCLPDVYSVLGWENVIPVMDYEDFQTVPKQVEYVKDRLKNEKQVLFFGETYKALYGEDEWIILSIFDKFWYCMRYDNEKYDKIEGIIALCEEWGLDDLDFINVVFLNLVRRYPTDEEIDILLENMHSDVEAIDRQEVAEIIQEIVRESEEDLEQIDQ